MAAARVSSCGICGGQIGTGAGFLRVLRFLLPIFIPPTAPQSPSSSIWGWYNRTVLAAVPSGLSLIPLRIIIKKVTAKPVYITTRKCERTRLVKKQGWGMKSEADVRSK
jgi:hypothetical protein